MSRVQPVEPQPRVVTAALTAALRGRGPAVLPLPADPAERARLLAVARPDQPLEHPAAVVIATSGSTGNPKAVLLGADALRASADATHQRLGGPGQWLLALPPSSIAGLQVLVRSVLAGTVAAVAGTEVGAVSRSVEQMTGPRRYAAIVPTQLRRWLANCPQVLRRFDAVLVGGGPTGSRLLQQARDAGVRVVPTYGMTETAGGCVYEGRPLAGVDVRIGTAGTDDTDDTASSDGTDAPGGPGVLGGLGGLSGLGGGAESGGTAATETGRIEITGPVLASGYRLDPRLTADCFVDGWFRTSDRGRLAGGRLQVLGQLDDVVISGGVNVSLEAVAQRVRSHPAVRGGVVVGVPDPEWGTVVVAVIEGELAIDVLREYVAAMLPRSWAPRRLVCADALPMLASGKVDRAKVLAELVRRDPAQPSG